MGFQYRKRNWYAFHQCSGSWLIMNAKRPYQGADGYIEEDAKLMAQAPGMYEALKSIPLGCLPKESRMLVENAIYHVENF